MTNTTPDLVPLIRTGDFAALREELVRWRPRELAEAIAELTAEDRVIAFRILPRRLAAAVFEYMPPATQRALVKAMGQEEIADLLNDMAPDDRTWFLSELPANATKQLLALLTPDEREEAVTLLGYAPGHSRPADDPALHRRQGRLDGAAGARLHPRARPQQRDAERHLRRRRRRRA